MKTTSLTTSAAVMQTDNVVIGGGAIASAAPDVVPDFLLLCKDGNIAEAVHALYYLPHNYKLMVMGESDPTARDNSWMDGVFLKDRIQFEDTETTDKQQSPYSFADAIISDETDAETVKSAAAPYVVVSATAGQGLTVNGTNGFTVQSGNPEALASAILHISRKG